MPSTLSSRARMPFLGTAAAAVALTAVVSTGGHTAAAPGASNAQTMSTDTTGSTAGVILAAYTVSRPGTSRPAASRPGQAHAVTRPVIHAPTFITTTDHANAKKWASGLRRLRTCESGGNYRAATGNGYYGAYQFNISTWRSLGLSGLPSHASQELQDAAVTRLHARKGWGPWPVCSYVAGLR